MPEITDDKALELMAKIEDPDYLSIFIDTLGMDHDQRVRVVTAHQKKNKTDLSQSMAKFYADKKSDF